MWRKKNKRLWVWCLCLWIGLSLGCGQEQICQGNEDCSSGQCVGGYCKPQKECKADKDCPLEQGCELAVGLCVRCRLGCSGWGVCEGGLCLCREGYAGAGCQECATGFTGYPDCLPTKACPSACSNHGTCNSSGLCICSPTFTGPACDSCASGFAGYPNCQPTKSCPGNCSNHGSCNPSGICACAPSFTGSACNTCAIGYVGYPDCQPTKACPSSCSNHGTCNPTTGLCSCNTGYSGLACDSCASGFAGYPDCQPIKACPSACSNHGTCNPTTGLCYCHTGYTGAACQACAAGFAGYPNCQTVPQAGSIGGSCTQDPKNPRGNCDTGLICVNISQNPSKAVCFQDCKASPNICVANTADGRTLCQDTNGSGLFFVCVGEVGKDQPCGFETKSQARCKGGQTPLLYCSPTSNTCKEAVVQKNAGDPCNRSNDNTEPLKLCDEAGSGLVCDQQTGTCKKAEQADEAQECDPQGTDLGKQVLCKTGNICIDFGSSKRCHRSCVTTGPGTECTTAGTKCLALLSNGGGLCMDDTCTSAAECAFKDYVCEVRQSGGKLCVPPQPPGPTPAFGICKLPARQFGCQAGLVCLTEQGSASGFCSKDCTAAGTTCPTVTDGGQTFQSACIIATGTANFCGITCTQDTACPDSLRCTSTLCVARVPCTQDTDCPSGFVCGTRGLCVAKPCTQDTDCPSSFVCQNGRCAAKP